jgi:hypothetical protein
MSPFEEEKLGRAMSQLAYAHRRLKNANTALALAMRDMAPDSGPSSVERAQVVLMREEVVRAHSEREACLLMALNAWSDSQGHGLTEAWAHE